MEKRNLLFFPLLVLLTAVLTVPVRSQDNAGEKALPVYSTASFFNQVFTDSREVVSITIETDVKKLVGKKYQEEYQPAKMALTLPGQAAREMEIEIRSRGNVRKKVCYYPPVKIKFKKKDLQEAGMAEDFNVLKIVNQCRQGSVFEQYLFKEFLSYQLYGIVSPHHFRVKLLEINYVDPQGKAKPLTMYGFLIEPEEELAARLNGVFVERTTCSFGQLEPEPALLMGAFEYMIGNTDWSIRNIHNLGLFKLEQFTKMIAIPYDFDYAGLVNTDYAVPFESFPIKSVRDRYYIGPACREADMPAIIQHFQDRKDQILSTCEQFPYLDDRNRKDVMSYLSAFFEMLDSPKILDREFRVE